MIHAYIRTYNWLRTHVTYNLGVQKKKKKKSKFKIFINTVLKKVYSGIFKLSLT